MQELPASVLTVSQVADLIQCDRDKVYRLLKEGQMPGRKVGGEWRVVARQLMAWLEDGR